MRATKPLALSTLHTKYMSAVCIYVQRNQADLCLLQQGEVKGNSGERMRGITKEQCWDLGRRLMDESAITGQL